jgi:signal transduction histidine kinase/ActR/RegA family two-component response regulator
MPAPVLSLTEVSGLLEAVQALARTQELEAVTRVVLGAARHLTGADGVSFVVREGDQLHYVDEDAIAPLWRGERVPVSSRTCGWAIVHGKNVTIDDVHADARADAEACRGTFVKGVAIVPIRREEPLGAIGAYWAREHRASDREIFVLETLANAAAGAIANLELWQNLREANRAKDEFLAMLGHELRNPLAPIVTALHLLRLRAPSGIEKECTVIERQVGHLIRLVDDLLDISRVARGKIELKQRPLKIADAIGKAIEMVSPVLEQRKHRMTISVPRRGLDVLGDETRLAQVLANLLTNAAKYSEPESQIEVSAERDGDRVSIHVRDHGIGIAPEMLPRVFDLFVQDRQALDRSQGGLGLGLAIARGLVEKHGGKIRAHSDGIGCGAEFSVTLPAFLRDASEPRARDAASAGLIAPMGDRRRVLVVDDNADAAEMLAAVVESAGYDTQVAHDGPSALAVAATFQPDIALVDIGLPVMDGYELAGRLREALPQKELRLMAVTGYGLETDRQRARRAGFDLHFVKPVDVHSLLKALDDSAHAPANGIPRPRAAAASDRKATPQRRRGRAAPSAGTRRST